MFFGLKQVILVKPVCVLPLITKEWKKGETKLAAMSSRAILADKVNVSLAPLMLH